MKSNAKNVWSDIGGEEEEEELTDRSWTCEPTTRDQRRAPKKPELSAVSCWRHSRERMVFVGLLWPRFDVFIGNRFDATSNSYRCSVRDPTWVVAPVMSLIDIGHRTGWVLEPVAVAVYATVNSFSVAFVLHSHKSWTCLHFLLFP